MASGISVTISANDAATGVINKINTGLENLNRKTAAARAPMDRMAASLGRFGRLTGISQAASDVNGLGRQIGNAAASLGRFAPALGAITGAASVAGLAGLVERWTAFGSRLGLDSQRIGMTAAGLHGLQGAARLAGSSAEALTSGMQSLGDNLTNAVAGRSPETVAMMSALGLSWRDAATGGARLAKDVLPEIADKISRIENPTRRAMVATALLGSAGESLMPLFMRGAAGIRELNAEAEKNGLTNERGVQAAQALSKAQVDLSEAIEGVGNAVSEQVAPVLIPMLRQLRDWVRENRGEIAGFFGTIARAIKDWTDDGGLTRLIEHLKAVYDTLARIVGIADSVGHGLRKAWDAGEGKRFIDEYGNPIGPADAPIPGLPPPLTAPTVPTVPGQGNHTPGGWIERNMPTWLGGRPSSPSRLPGGPMGNFENGAPPVDLGLSDGLRQRAGGLVQQLAADFGLTREQASGITGNLAHESGLQAVNERNPLVAGSRGGVGWAQWTGPRREAFEHWTADRHLDPRSDQANYGFLQHELRDTDYGRAAIDRVKRETTTSGATTAFYPFESGGDPRAIAALPHRQALAAMADQSAAALPTLAAPVPPVPAMAPLGAQGQPGPDGKATVRVTFDNPPPNMKTSTVAQGGLRIETPTLGLSP